MAQIQLTNFGDSQLASGITAGSTYISVTTGHGTRFPTLAAGDWFYAVLVDTSGNREIVKATAKASDTFTVDRAQEGTTALAFAVGSVFSLRLTLRSLQDYIGSVAATPAGDNTWTGTQTFRDNKFEVTDDSDTSKKVVLQVSGVTTATTRTLTVPDANITLAGINATQTFSAPQRGYYVQDNDGSFDLSASQNFLFVPTAGATITFTNIAAATGQSGYVLMSNGSNYAMAKHANTKSDSTFLTKISASGTYLIGYFCDGANVYVTAAGTMS